MHEGWVLQCKAGRYQASARGRPIVEGVEGLAAAGAPSGAAPRLGAARKGQRRLVRGGLQLLQQRYRPRLQLGS